MFLKKSLSVRKNWSLLESYLCGNDLQNLHSVAAWSRIHI